jgi:DNA-binding NtrC family response regulator
MYGLPNREKNPKGVEVMRILAIDDEQIVLDSVRKILTQENYEVDCFLSSKEGLAHALKNDYDLVLTDIRMPEIGGMRILRDIKRSKPTLPVIIITGYATIKSAVQAMQLGATNYIEKPFTPDVLINAITVGLKAGKSTSPEEQAIVNKEEVLKVLERAAHDSDFVSALYYEGADALKDYRLTGPEKLAILTADMAWIEEHVGELTDAQRRWLQQRLSAEIW